MPGGQANAQGIERSWGKQQLSGEMTLFPWWFLLGLESLGNPAIVSVWIAVAFLLY